MNSSLRQRVAALWHAEFFSPKDFLWRALVISIAFYMAHLAGLREFTSLLNGTMGSVEFGWKVSAFLGLSCILLYLAFVLVVPILVLAAIILALWRKFLRQDQRAT